MSQVLTACSPVERRLVEAARSYLGVPWRDNGRSRDGVDCIGLLELACHDAGIYEDLSYTGYTRVPDANDQLRRGMYELFEPAHRAVPGAIILLSFTATPWHVGIVGDGLGSADLSLIHAYQAEGKVCEHRMSQEWGGRYRRGLFRVPEALRDG